MRGLAGLLFFAPFVLTACTTTLVSREDNGASGQSGVSYRLPLLQYTITAKYTLVSCTPDAETLPFQVDVSVEPSVIEGEDRLIEYTKLGNHFKTSAFSVDYYAGTQLLKSINAGVTDRGPEIATAVLKAAVSVAKIAYGVPSVPIEPSGGGAPVGICLSNVAGVVKASNDVRKAIREFPEKTQEITDRLAVFRTMVQVGAMTAADKKQAAMDLKISVELERSLESLLKQVAFYDKRLTYEAQWRFPNYPTQLDMTLTAPKAMSVWLSTLFDPSQNVRKSMSGQLSLSASLSPAKTLSPCDAAKSCDGKCQCPASASTTNDGIGYRKPAAGVLKVCYGSDSAICKDAPHPLVIENAQVPQFGVMHFLPLHNGWGQDNELSATFAKSGELTSFRYASKAAPAERAANIAADAAGQASSIANARHAKDASDAAAATEKVEADRKTEVDTIQHDIDVATLKGERAKILAMQADPDLAALSSETSKLAAEVALLEVKEQKALLLDALEGKP